MRGYKREGGREQQQWMPVVKTNDFMLMESQQTAVFPEKITRLYVG